MKVHVWLALTQIGDLVTTAFFCAEMEANPLMRVLWERFGFWSLVLVKTAFCMLMLLYHWGIKRWLPYFERCVRIGLWLATCATLLITIWNGGLIWLNYN